MTDSSGSPKGVEADLWTKPEKTINEKIKDLCPIVIEVLIVTVAANVLESCAACLGLPSLLYAINTPFPAFVLSVCSDS